MSDAYAADDFEDLGSFEDELEPIEEAPEPAPVSIEARARAMGWKPLADFKGDPRRWTDAATFIAHGEEELPILRDQNRRMSEKLARLDPAEIETLRNTVAQQAVALKRAEAIARRADQAGYDRALTELKAKQREAVETGDTVVFDQVQAQIDASLKARREAEEADAVAPTPVPTPAPDGEWPETTAFKRENPWVMSDPILRNAMIAAHGATIDAFPTISRAEQYARARAQVVEAFPHKFPPAPAPADLEEEPLAREPAPAPARQPARQAARAAVMAPSSPAAAAPRRGSPFDQIDEADRAEARAGYDYARKGDPDLPASEYVALYLNPKLNPIELRLRRKKA